MKKFILYIFLFIALFIFTSCDETGQDNKIDAPTPQMLKVNNKILSWAYIENATEFKIDVTFNGITTTYKSTTNTLDLSNILNDEGDYEFKVTTLKGKSFISDSSESSLTYKWTKNSISYTLFQYNFKTLASLDDFDRNVKDKYADGSIKFDKVGAYITTPAFETTTSFSVTANIIGKNTSGDATITFYGLDSSGKVLETVPITGPLQNSSYNIKAEFNNSNIKKIKIEFTTKATGNFGLVAISAKTDTDDEKLISISCKDINSQFAQNSSFDYSGTLVLNYKSGKSEEINILDNKNLIKVSNFDTIAIGTKTATLEYQSLKTSFQYLVTHEYDAIYNYLDYCDLYFIDLDDNPNNYLTIISLKESSKQLNILIDYGFDTSLYTNTLKLELESIAPTIDYYYSNSNLNEIVGDAIKLTQNKKYNLAPYININVNDEYYILEVFGYTYLDSNNINVTTYNNINKIYSKIDFLKVNNNITSDLINSFDPEVVILPEGSLASILKTAKLVYTTNNNIYQYSPTLNSTFNMHLTDTSYEFDGLNCGELSTHFEWGINEATSGLHHASLTNYFYRSSYYGDIADLQGDALKNALCNVITTTHTKAITYGEARYTAINTDTDPLNPDNIILIYSGDSINGTWDNGVTWNREHVWPKSLSGGLYTDISNEQANAGSDLHQLKPEYSSVNASRNNKPYGNATNSETYCPRSEVQGDVARILFYMAVRYNMDFVKLKVVASASILLDWNKTDLVDSFERNRNNVVQSYQGNFNPFIDNPWFADAIWG